MCQTLSPIGDVATDVEMVTVYVRQHEGPRNHDTLAENGLNHDAVSFRILKLLEFYKFILFKRK